ncbi:restriction endonuclease subunit S [Corynebacterium spheniscorum]|uniref:Type I restriction modification DNA specificity domain-containing protein n=1 Tax=Corynebacterium spheniscorum TaxID=185761 RepID=A0A1I2QJ86_9CORY|nr:restriction endonuclease subunit S [Corynebacterium spheniscorum]KAA8719359.1 hypothetical protein F4V56_10070 [Corynebacterium spheniscorum]SFG28030.1 Type I restriction modification DNA specificity domain-containing protein [Corynebacterium spheniscorum]
MKSDDISFLDSPVFPVAKLHTFANILNGKTPSSDDRNWGGDIPFLTPPDLNGLDGKEITSVDRRITDLGLRNSSRLVEKGVIFSCRAPVGYVGRITSPSAFNQGCKVVVTNQDHRYVAYALTASKTNLQALANGTTFSEISTTAVENYAIPLPTLATQRRIADYLDREATEIDTAVADLDHYIKLLNQRCRHFVSKELRKDEFPAVPFFTIASITSGDGITQESIEDFGPYPVYGGNGLRGYTDSFNQSVDRILIGRQGALCGNIHHAHGPFFASEHALIVQPRRSINLVWLEHALRDLNLGRLSQASAQPGIGASEVSRQRITFPPRETQNVIAETICDELAKAHALIAESTKLRDLLLKRRSVLITEVVTGRKQV